LLSSYGVEELKNFCIEEKIDFSEFSNDPNEKQRFIQALATTYPPDPIRQHHLHLLQLEDRLKIVDDNENEHQRDELLHIVNQMFDSLLTKLQIEDKARKSFLMNTFSMKEKMTYLRNSIWYVQILSLMILPFFSVLDDDSQFMRADEVMLTQMQTERYVDSIRLLTCKYRILHAHSDWLSNFCRSGGLFSSSSSPLPSSDHAPLLRNLSVGRQHG
jgi:hypothetical protein